MPFPENLRNNLARTERVQLDTNGATVACLRLDDKIRWCYEHIAPVGARAEMLRIRNEPVAGLLVGQLFHYVDDFDLDGTVDLGSTTLLQGEPHAPVGVVSQFFYRGTGRGDQFRGDYQKLYDDGIQVSAQVPGRVGFFQTADSRTLGATPLSTLTCCAEAPRGSNSRCSASHVFRRRGEPRAAVGS